MSMLGSHDTAVVSVMILIVPSAPTMRMFLIVHSTPCKVVRVVSLTVSVGGRLRRRELGETISDTSVRMVIFFSMLAGGVEG